MFKDYVINDLEFSKWVLYEVWFAVLVENNSRLKNLLFLVYFLFFLFLKSFFGFCMILS